MYNTYFSNVVSIGSASGGFYIYNYIMHPVKLGIPYLFLRVQFVYLSNGFPRMDFIDFGCYWRSTTVVAGPLAVRSRYDAFDPVSFAIRRYRNVYLHVVICGTAVFLGRLFFTWI